MKAIPSSFFLRITSLMLSIIVPWSTVPGYVWAAATPVQSSGKDPSVVSDPFVVPDSPPAPPKPVCRLPSTDVKFEPLPKFSSEPTDAEFSQVRMFDPQLVPLGTSSASENKALAGALAEYVARTNPEDQPSLLRFLEQFPQSVWKPALLVNLGVLWRQQGFFSRAMNAWSEAWSLTRNESSYQARIVADRAFAELMQMNAWGGRIEAGESLLAEAGDRQFTSGSREMVVGARESLWQAKNRPQVVSGCGPYALRQILSTIKPNANLSLSFAPKSPDAGFSLTELKALAADNGLKYRIAKRSPGSDIPLNSIVHWKLNHYGAIIGKEKERYIIKDGSLTANFGRELWISQAAIDEESSGYFLIPEGSLPRGWQEVSAEEGSGIRGSFVVGFPWDRFCTRCHELASCPTCSRGMAKASVQLMLVSVHVADIPVGYAPPRGPSVDFQVTYNQREDQPTAQNAYSNLGDNWTHNYFSYIEDNGVTGNRISVTRRCANGGWMTHSGNAGTYAIDRFGGSLKYFPPPPGGTDRYELSFSDGSKLVFDKPDAGAGSTRRLLLGKEVDAAGNSIVIVYKDDGSGRIDHISDALGQSTTFVYEGTSKKIIKVTDPFLRSAQFDYDQLGRLKKITDVIGMSSSFSYDGVTTTMVSMSTPYGTTTFASTGTSDTRTLMVTDPNGGQEFFVSDDVNHGLTPEELPSVPGANLSLANLYGRNTFYFSKKAMQIPGTLNYNNATVYHWLKTDPSGSGITGILESKKAPLESRVWLLYSGQSTPESADGITQAQPTTVARVVDDATSQSGYSTQISRFEYNGLGNRTKVTDPLGRKTIFEYNSNGIDLETVRHPIDSDEENSEILAELGEYVSYGHPTLYTDASRQTYHLVWNSAGQLTQVTNPKNEVTHLNYDAGGYLQNVQRDWSGGTKTTSFTYDDHGRLYTVTDSDNYTLTYFYDALDRPIRVLYPDTTFERYDYARKDLVQVRDRAGHSTVMTYDNMGHPLTVKDSLGRVTQFSWCNCGALERIIDPLIHKTTWTRDIQGRVTDKSYEDTTSVQYTYEPRSGRLKTITDAKSQVKNYSYNIDGTLKGVTYIATINTPAVSFTWDPIFRRPATMTDGTGTTTFTYNPGYVPGSSGSVGFGVGQLAATDGPLVNDTISYGYDELGRTSSRAIDGGGEGITYDDLGRVSTHALPIGTFAMTYVNDSGRIARVDGGPGPTIYDYFDNAGDRRLKEIKNTWGGVIILPSGDPESFSKFDYKYDTLGRITQWTQQADFNGTPEVMKLDYDLEDQLLNATATPQGSTTPSRAYNYSYDKAGNRTSEQAETTGPSASFSTSLASFNNVNQLTSRSLGPVVFRGKVDEPATVKLSANGGAQQDAKMTQDPDSTTKGKIFTASLNLPTGQNSVQIVATDFAYPTPHNNAPQNQNYSLTVNPGADRSYNYDPNGNCIGYTYSGGSVGYDYDGEDRLIKITQVATGSPTLISEFTYDGLSRWVKIVERSNGSVTSTKRFVWAGRQLIQQRDGADFSAPTGSVIVKNFYPEGVSTVGHGWGADWQTTDNYPSQFYKRDHLGSVREVVDSQGNIDARYQYDPYGRRTKVYGTAEADFGFTGHYYHAPSGLHLALYRAYDAESGRWLNRDPIGEMGGLDLYAYVGNSPVDFADPTGLFFKEWFRKAGHWFYDNVMMGDRPGSYDPDSYLAQRTQMLGNDGADTLRNVIGEGAGIIGDQGTDLLAGMGMGRIFGLCKLGSKAPGLGRAFWVGKDGWDAALGSGIPVVPKAPSFAWAITSKFWAMGTQGMATVFYGAGRGDIFWEAELPELLNLVNEGRITIRYYFSGIDF